MNFVWPYGLSLWFPEWQGQSQEDATVPAGRFGNCFRIPSDDLGPNGARVTSLSWFHPIVPLGGLVRRQTLEGAAVKELVAFATSGASSDL